MFRSASAHGKKSRNHHSHDANEFQTLDAVSYLLHDELNWYNNGFSSSSKGSTPIDFFEKYDKDNKENRINLNSLPLSELKIGTPAISPGWC